MTKGAQVNVRLTERERTVLEMLAAGYSVHEIQAIVEPENPSGFDVEEAIHSACHWLQANHECHAIALAIRGGHIL